MRKIFITSMELEKMQPRIYLSDDFSVDNASYLYPITYMIQNEVENGDVVLVVSVVSGGSEEDNYAYSNCDSFEAEAKDALKAKEHIDLEFVRVEIDGALTSEAFNCCFKDIINLTDDDDEIYMDLSFGHRIFNFSMFVAASYAARATFGLNINTVLYASKEPGNKHLEGVPFWKVYDCTCLFRLNELAAEARPGDRIALEELLNFIIE